jgi:hypothetical protein
VHATMAKGWGEQDNSIMGRITLELAGLEER